MWGTEACQGQEDISRSHTGPFEESLSSAEHQGRGGGATKSVFRAFLLSACQRHGNSLRKEWAVFLGTSSRPWSPPVRPRWGLGLGAPCHGAVQKSDREGSCDMNCFPPVAHLLLCFAFRSPVISLKADWRKARWRGGSGRSPCSLSRGQGR